MAYVKLRDMLTSFEVNDMPHDEDYWCDDAIDYLEATGQLPPPATLKDVDTMLALTRTLYKAEPEDNFMYFCMLGVAGACAKHLGTDDRRKVSAASPSRLALKFLIVPWLEKCL